MNTALTDHHDKSISIALVEDHYRLREELSVYLSDEGFSLQSADSAEELSTVLSKHPIDIIILDLNINVRIFLIIIFVYIIVLLYCI